MVWQDTLLWGKSGCVLRISYSYKVLPKYTIQHVGVNNKFGINYIFWSVKLNAIDLQIVKKWVHEKIIN